MSGGAGGGEGVFRGPMEEGRGRGSRATQCSSQRGCGLHPHRGWESQAGAEGFLGKLAGGPAVPDVVIAKPHKLVPWAHPGHWSAREEELEDQNPRVKGPSVEIAGPQLSGGYIRGYSRPNK